MMQLVLIVLTKRKETIGYCVRVRWHNALNIIANKLTHVSVPAEDR
jgi:hypothetical protein